MRRNIARGAQWAFGIAVVVFAALALRRQWAGIAGRVLALHVVWWRLAAATLLVALTYAVLIETWRRVLAAWDAPLAWATAAQVWFASSLGKYVPGSLWSLAALGVMARERGASGIAAAGSSVLVNVLNLASGAALVLVFAAPLVPQPALVAAIAAAAVAGAVATPWLLPPLVARIARMRGRDLALPRVPPTTVWTAVVGTTLAWCSYGVAVRLFAASLLGAGAVRGATVLYIAAYTGAYILGFVTPVPAGIGVREFAIVQGFSRLGLMSATDAAVVAVMSRFWLTVLEVAPGVAGLALHHLRRTTRPA